MKGTKEKGAALLFAMIFVLVLSIMGISMMFLSQSETWSSMNYRLMTQARYGAEAGVQAAANYIANSYAQPGTVTDPLSNYTMTVSPVTTGGNPVALGSTFNGISANYPVAAVKTAFTTATAGSVTAGNNTVNYTANAELLLMKQIQVCGNAQPVTAQTWLITSHGDIGGVRNAEVELTAILEQQITPCYNYAGFATGNGCGSISFSGGGNINSYDSGNIAGGIQNYDGNLGSNGNLNAAPNTNVDGTFSTPRTGVGNCAAGAPDAISGNTTAVTGCESSTQLANSTCGAGLVPLSQQVVYQAPVIPSTLPGTVLTPTTVAGVTSLVPGSYTDISQVGSGETTFNPQLTGTPPNQICSAGVYYIDSLTLGGSGVLDVAPCPLTSTTPGAHMDIIINVLNTTNTNPVSIQGGSFANPTLDPRLFQIQYAGTGTLDFGGNPTAAGLVYAPNATVNMHGSNSDWYGSIIAKTISMASSGISLHYDRRLSADLFTVGNWTLDSFNWSKSDH
jgi:Tfp pilus assembly protein PilX